MVGFGVWIWVFGFSLDGGCWLMIWVLCELLSFCFNCGGLCCCFGLVLRVCLWVVLLVGFDCKSLVFYFDYGSLVWCVLDLRVVDCLILGGL